MKKYLFLAAVLALSVQLSAQQIPASGQYYFNHYALNPAATGTTNTFPLSFSYRKMWTGIDDSPSNIYFSGEMNVAKAMGVGLKFYNYSAGPLRRTGAELSYSYHLEFNQDLHLAFGLSGLFYQFYLDKTELSFEEADDAVLSGQDQMFVPDVSFGTYLYGKNYYVGISVPNLFNRNIDLKTDDVLQQKQVRHYYLFGGYNFEVNPDLMIKPSALVKFIETGLYQIDVNALVEYKNMFVGGVAFRSSDAVVFQLGFRYQEIFFGYAYDLSIGELAGNTFGSHDIFLQYTLPNFIAKRGPY
ncbi:MAG: type IX secretion system membrane protein PorP/SprF [Bacteroidales bacterium]|nr:type IX secretion system membrane protein PorP/SprF [Bacteroidales bacterium]